MYMYTYMYIGIEGEKVGHNACCEVMSVSVAYVLWDCLAKIVGRAFTLILLGSKFSLDSLEKTSYTVGSE